MRDQHCRESVALELTAIGRVEGAVGNGQTSPTASMRRAATLTRRSSVDNTTTERLGSHARRIKVA
jgi:hypothetical protein